jgi:phosphate transport system substrate-binding protein
MLRHSSTRLALVAILCLCVASCEHDDVSSLQGAGATFPGPLYKRWFLEYYHRHPEVRVNYQAIGSGAGVRQFTAGLTAFGASDAPMSKAEVKAFEERFPDGVLQLPMTAGNIAVCYNLPGGPPDLRLSRDALLQIFLGTATEWNDPVIAACNKGASLPETPITVVRRAEGSGTTFAFTSHLAAVSPKEWVGEDGKALVGKSIKWPCGIGAKGNAGVAALIQQTPGAIGYLEFGYAELTQLPDGSPLPIASLENKGGNFVKPSAESGLAALEGLQLPADLCLQVPDPAAPKAYPIVTYTWVLCHKDYHDERKAREIKALLAYCLGEGQMLAAELGYIPLPRATVQKVRHAAESIAP